MLDWTGDNPEDEQAASDGEYRLRASRYFDHATKSFRYMATVRGASEWVFRSFNDGIHPTSMKGAMLLAEAMLAYWKMKGT